MVAWLTYATAMCYVAAYWVPDHSLKAAEERLLDPEAPASRGDYPYSYARNEYDPAGAQATAPVPAANNVQTAVPITASAKFEPVNRVNQRKTVPISSLALPDGK
jgi:hypothetical protein